MIHEIDVTRSPLIRPRSQRESGGDGISIDIHKLRLQFILREYGIVTHAYLSFDRITPFCTGKERLQFHPDRTSEPVTILRSPSGDKMEMSSHNLHN